ncbi:hypothetical protein [Agrobacterium sp.]|uniref:hypothetical protein n=1 Tax=Agrobacterium sp. TaxID=361 RepID=UPI0025C5D793|nr:hypothetical protein [Agrobacterium sp.]MCD4661449.1 hypothetical protein [Agrobacterium sp.]
MAETRTKKQIEANRIDMEIFHVIGMLDQFAEEYEDADVAALSRTMFCSRGDIRKHMHGNDRRATV